MQFATKSTSVKKETINLYTYPPRGDIELKKFEELASSRLKGKIFNSLLAELSLYLSINRHSSSEIG